jgi:oligopeptide transport system permease protein
MTDTSVSQGSVPAEITGRSLTELAVMRFKRNKAAMAGCVMLFLIALFSFAGPFFVPHTYDQVFASSCRDSTSRRARLRRS